MAALLGTRAPSSSSRSLILLVGLALEVRIVHQPGVLVLCPSHNCEVPDVIQQALRKGCRRIISCGVAGGLAPIWAQAIASLPRPSSTPNHHGGPIRSGRSRLMDTIPGVRHGPVAGVHSVVSGLLAKRDLREATVQWGSTWNRIVADLADRVGLDFVVLRVVVDPACSRLLYRTRASFSIGIAAGTGTRRTWKVSSRAIAALARQSPARCGRARGSSQV
jgi:hypothetical protein